MQGHQRETISSQNNPKDTITTPRCQTSPKSGNSNGFVVDENTLLQTKSRRTDFKSFQACNSRGKTKISYGLNQVKNKYHDRVFTITDYHGDNELKTFQ